MKIIFGDDRERAERDVKRTLVKIRDEAHRFCNAYRKEQMKMK